MRWMADLHIHSALSPCGSLEMSPRRIVERAFAEGINLIAITDHNACQNCLDLQSLAEEQGIHAFCGMEVQTEEEVHVLTLFARYQDLEQTWQVVYDKLPNAPNRPDFFGDQVVVDREDNIRCIEERLLINSSQIGFSDLLNLVEKHRGLAIPAHVDSPTFSLVSQLGFIPPQPPLFAVEISYNSPIPWPCEERYADLPLVSFSDAHYPGEIGRATTLFQMEQPTIEELKLALRGLARRKILSIERRPRCSS